MSNMTLQLKLKARDDGLKATVDSAKSSVDGLSQQFVELERKIDPTTATMRDLKNAQEVARREFESGRISLDRYNKTLDLVDRTYGRTAVGGIKNLGHTVGQLGYQLQDSAVQFQNNTDASVILAQQGSQIASIFGPGGAVIGALLAVSSVVGGTLLSSMLDSANATDVLETSLDSLKSIIKETKDGTILLTDEIMALAVQSRSAAELEITRGLLLAGDALNASKDQLGDTLDDSLGGLLYDFDTVVEHVNYQSETMKRSLERALQVGDISGDAVAGVQVIRGQLEDLQDDYGLTEAQAISFVESISHTIDEPTVANLKGLQETISNLGLATQDTSPAFTKLSATLVQNVRTIIESTERTEELKAALSDLDTVLKNNGTEESRLKREQEIEATNRFIASLNEESALLRIQANDKDNAVQKSLEYKASLLDLNDAQKSVVQTLIEQIALDKERIALQRSNEKNNAVISGLQGELELMQMTARERAVEIQARKLDANATSEQVAESKRLAVQIYDVAAAKKAEAEADKERKKQLIEAKTAAQRFLQDGNLGEIEGLESIQEQLQDAMSVKGITADMEADFSEAIDKIQSRIKDLKFNNMVDGISAGISSLQSLTEEGSDSYQKMQVALAALNLAQATYAVLNQAGGDPYTAIPRMAAMITAVGQLGVALNGIGSGDVAAQRQASQGTGGVLGDASAKSESILKSNETIADAVETIVGINRSMLDALLSLEVSINGAALQITRKWDDSVDAPASTEIGWLPPSAAISSVISDVLGMTDLGGLVADLWGASVKGKDSGLVLEASNLGNLSAQSYMTWEERKNWLDDYDTKWKFTDLDSQITQQLRLVMGGISDSVRAGADQLGMSGDAIDQAIQSFALERTLISLKDLTADEQQEELQAVFSSVFDDLSGHVMPWLVEFQQAGEGLGETLSRLATEASAVDNVVGMLGLTFGDVDDKLRAQTNLVSAMGGLEEFVSAYSSFSDKFLSEEQQFANARDQLQSAFAQYDAILPASREDYLALVQAQDAATDAGAKTIAKLFELSDAADEYYSLLEDREDDRLAVAQQRSGLMRQLYELEGNSEAALKLTREAELSALDESNRELQQRIYLLQDEADLADTIRANVSNAFNQLSQSITAEIDNLTTAWTERQQSLNDEIELVSNSTSALETFINALANTQSQLNETTQLDFINAQRTAFEWLDNIRGGNWMEPTGYQDILGHLGNLNSDWYANEVDYERDRKITSNALAEAQKLAGNQLSVEDETLLTLQDTLALEKRAYDNAVEDLEAQREFWQKELNAINGVDDAVLSVEDAIQKLKEALQEAWEEIGVTNDDIRTWLEANANAQLTVNDIITAMTQAGVTGAQIANALGLEANDTNDASDSAIRAWIAANPNATDADLSAAMRIWGVSIERLASLLDVSVAEVQQRYYDAIPDQVIDQISMPTDAGHTDSEVLSWLQQNGGATLADVADAMREFGVTIEQMARVTGWTVQDVESAYLGLDSSTGESTDEVYVDGRQNSANQTTTSYPSDGGQSDADVKSWLAQNSGANAAQIAAAMDQYGVTIEQMARVSGWSVADVRAAYQSVNGSHANGLDSVPFDGYIAQLHKGEMVLPAGQSDYLRNGETAKQFKALKDEIVTLRKSNSALLAQISKNSASSAKTAKQLSKGAPVYIMNQASQQEAQ